MMHKNREKYNPALIYSANNIKPYPQLYSKFLFSNKNNKDSLLIQQQQKQMKEALSSTRMSFLRNKATDQLATSRYSNQKIKNLQSPVKKTLKENENQFQEKLQKLTNLQQQKNIAPFYYYYFLQILKSKTPTQKYQLVIREIKNLNDEKTCYYLKIIDLIDARENIFSLIMDLIVQKFSRDYVYQALDKYVKFTKNKKEFSHNEIDSFVGTGKNYSNQKITINELDTILRHIKMYRMLTIKIILLIFDWQKWIKYNGFSQPVQFLYKNEDYLMKIHLSDTNRIKQSTFFQKNPYFLLKKQFEKRPWKILFNELKSDSIQSQQIIKCNQILVFHTARLIKYKIISNINQSRISPGQKLDLHLNRNNSIERQYRSEPKFLPAYHKRKNQEQFEEDPQQLKYQKNLLQYNNKPLTVSYNPSAENDEYFYTTFMNRRMSGSTQLKGNNKLHRPQIVYNKVSNDSNRIQKTIFASGDYNTMNRFSNQSDSILKKSIYKQDQLNLKFEFVQFQENEVLEFLEDLFSSSKPKSSEQLEHYLRIILQNKEIIVIKIINFQKIVGIVLGLEQKNEQYKQYFELLELIKIKDVKNIQEHFIKYIGTFNKYHQVSYKNIKYDLDVENDQGQSSSHIRIKVIFQNDKRWKNQMQVLASQNPNLYVLYKNRLSEKQYYDLEDEKFTFQYQMVFNQINQTKMIINNSSVTNYYKIKSDKAIKLAVPHKQIQGYRLFFYGIKQIIQIFSSQHADYEIKYDYIQNSVEGTELNNTDVMIPTSSTKFQYIGSDSEKILFHEYIKINNKMTIPLTLIRHEKKFTKSIIIKKPFIMRIMNAEKVIYMCLIKD